MKKYYFEEVSNLKNIKKHVKKILNDSYTPNISNGKCWFIISKESGAVCGVAAVAIDTVCKLGMMTFGGVYPEYEGQGLHKEIYKIREKFLSDNGIERVITYISRDNYRSLKNAFDNGYKIYEPKLKYTDGSFYHLMKRL